MDDISEQMENKVVLWVLSSNKWEGRFWDAGRKNPPFFKLITFVFSSIHFSRNSEHISINFNFWISHSIHTLHSSSSVSLSE